MSTVQETESKIPITIDVAYNTGALYFHSWMSDDAKLLNLTRYIGPSWDVFHACSSSSWVRHDKSYWMLGTGHSPEYKLCIDQCRFHVGSSLGYYLLMIYTVIHIQLEIITKFLWSIIHRFNSHFASTWMNHRRATKYCIIRSTDRACGLFYQSIFTILKFRFVNISEWKTFKPIIYYHNWLSPFMSN